MAAKEPTPPPEVDDVVPPPPAVFTSVQPEEPEIPAPVQVCIELFLSRY